jgi:alkylhydroperoxidase family enzyme
VAADVARALAGLEAAAWQAMAGVERVDLLDLAARVMAAQHGLAPLARPAALGPGPWSAADPAAWRRIEALSDAERSALAFAEQLSFDIASVQEDQRAALFEGLGAAAVPFVQAVFVADFLPRARAALDALFGASTWAAPSLDEPQDLQAAFDALIRRVPGLQAVDPVTTEAVRLLGARRHRCRICQSLRSRSALVAGADDALFDAVDRHAESDLAPAQKAALAFCEALIGVPGCVDAACAAALRSHFAPEACVEIVLDITRNATNKVAVALAADAPNVEEGVEIYDVAPDGELLFGLEAP